MIDYEKIGLKMGLEIHQQLNTDRKLFCGCNSNLTDKKPDSKVLRNLRPTQSELGKIDRAAFEEARRKLKFIYEAYIHETCLVEADEEPPNPLNLEALEISLVIASLLNMQVVNEFHIMRKQVIDGSNTGGFQRTGLVATDGFLDTDYGKVGIENLCLEEDAARRIGHEKGSVVFRLDRLGIPLVEITTSPSMKHPEQIKEVAYQLGQVLRSDKVKRGIGTIRQDLNISIREGARVEIKGVQDLDLMPRMVENEVERQINLIDIKKVLQERNAQVKDGIYEVEEIFEDTTSNIIAKSEKVLAIKLKGFSGLIGRKIQSDRRFGTELAVYAQKMGLSGILHSDELPAYGISSEEVYALGEFLEVSEDDAFILIADNEENARNALVEVQRRAKIAINEIPEETRKALPDGNTEYLRPLPTASRMYVETDIPTISISHDTLERIRSTLPELPEENKERIMDVYDLAEDLAAKLVKEDQVDKFEMIMGRCKNINPVIPASNLAYTFKELKREGCKVDRLNEKFLIDIYRCVEKRTVPAEATSTLLRDACQGIPPQESVRIHGLKMLSENDIKNIINEIIASNLKMIEERGMDTMGPLMGMAMQKLKGKADGKLVNNILKEKLKRTIKDQN